MRENAADHFFGRRRFLASIVLRLLRRWIPGRS
nr:MAG TPA: hypothetical protein [Inoviridae sp.]